MPDVDRKTYLAGAVAILSDYPPRVIEALADPRTGTRYLGDYPSLRSLREACDRLNEPFERDARRTRRGVADLPRPPRTPEQQKRIDAQIAALRRVFPPGQRRYQRAPNYLPPPLTPERRQAVLADCAARRARHNMDKTHGF